MEQASEILMHHAVAHIRNLTHFFDGAVHSSLGELGERRICCWDCEVLVDV